MANKLFSSSEMKSAVNSLKKMAEAAEIYVNSIGDFEKVSKELKETKDKIEDLSGKVEKTEAQVQDLLQFATDIVEKKTLLKV